MPETPEELSRRKKREYYKANWDKYAAWRESYKLKKRVLNQRWNANVSLEQKMIWSAKRRARNKGLEFSITAKDISIPEFCPLLNIPLYKSKTGKPTNNSPTLDRKDNTLGYTKDNVWVISHKANSVKNSLAISELELLISSLREATSEQRHSSRRQEGGSSIRVRHADTCNCPVCDPESPWLGEPNSGTTYLRDDPAIKEYWRRRAESNSPLL